MCVTKHRCVHDFKEITVMVEEGNAKKWATVIKLHAEHVCMFCMYTHMLYFYKHTILFKCSEVIV